MDVAKSQISQAVSQQITKFQEWAIYHQGQLLAASENGMTGCVFIQKVSPRKCHVGWRFTAEDTEPGAIQVDPHLAYDRNQEIAWVAARIMNITKKQISDVLLQLAEEGLVVGLLVDNKVEFIHIEHTDDEMLKNKLSIPEIKAELAKHT